MQYIKNVEKKRNNISEQKKASYIVSGTDTIVEKLVKKNQDTININKTGIINRYSAVILLLQGARGIDTQIDANFLT